MSLGTDGEERLPTGSLFDAKENGGADFQCRAVDHRYPARTQAGRPFTLRVVRESFNRRVIGLMTHTTGTNSCPIVSVGTSGDRRCTTGVVHFDIVHKAPTMDEFNTWASSQAEPKRWGCLFYGGSYGAWAYDRYTSPAELVNYSGSSSQRNLAIGNPGPKWREQDKVWLKATKTIRPGQRLYTAYGVGSTHHKKIVKECQDFEAAKDHAKIARCIAMGAAQVKNKNARKNANIANLNKRRR